jgi:hypothetical protein
MVRGCNVVRICGLCAAKTLCTALPMFFFPYKSYNNYNSFSGVHGFEKHFERHDCGCGLTVSLPVVTHGFLACRQSLLMVSLPDPDRCSVAREPA